MKIVLEHLTKQFPPRGRKAQEPVTAVSDFNFAVPDGQLIGLLGPSGCGKSTTLNMICGLEKPTSGRILFGDDDVTSFPPERRGVGMVFQNYALYPHLTVKQNILFPLQNLKGKDKLSRSQMDERAQNAARLVQITELMDRRPSELSGGQRTKVLLGKLLLEKPDILLLDEPTNYLDVSHIEWLKRYLNDYENAFILISHDIPFLNSVVNLIYHMDNQQLTRYVGDYDKFQEVYAMKKAQLEAAYNKQQKEIADLKDFVARNKARVATRNMAMARQKKLDKMDIIELDREKPKPEFHFKTARTSGKMIFETNDLVIGYDEPLTKPLNIRMERGERIALTGANGIGKTTLLKSILQLIKPYSGEVHLGDYQHIGYFEQESDTQNTSTCIEEIWSEFPAMTQYEIRSMLAKCGLTTKHIESQVRVLSGGEQAKVRLCKILNRESNILLLDEPTNHLDVDAKAELKKALQEYKGSILLICHEPEFYHDIVTTVWNCQEWSLKL